MDENLVIGIETKKLFSFFPAGPKLTMEMMERYNDRKKGKNESLKFLSLHRSIVSIVDFFV
jgi:hypothetical protein